MLSKRENKSSSSGSAGLIELFRALRLALGERFRRVYLVAALGLISGLLEVLILYLIALIGTAVVRQSSTVTVSLPLVETLVVDVPDIIRLALLILATLLALVYPLSRSAASLNRIALNRTRKRLTDAYMNSEWALRSRDPEGHMQILVGEYCTATESLVQHVSTIVISLGTLTMIAIATVLSAPIAAGVALLGTVVIASLVRPMNRRIKKRAADVATVNKLLASSVAEVSRVAPEIAAFSVGEKVLTRLKDQIEAIGLKTARLRLMTRMAPLVYQYGALILVVLIVAVMFNISPSALAGAGPVILMMIRALGYSKQLQTSIQAGSALLPYPEFVENEIERLQRRRVVDRTAVIGDFEQVELRNVSFAYLKDSVLQNVNLTIQAGEAVGVVGPSGGGKSTLVQLLLRLQTPTSGSIEINGTDPRSIDDHCWASLIAYVPQDNKLIHGSVVDNIRFFREGYELDSVVRAAQAAHLHHEIERLPDGYDTVIGAGASDLSGGQRQRLGIARAMLAEPEILVLDEPTSALDQRSEELLKTTLEELRGRQTLILVAHRPSTLKVCQRILIVDKGSISSASPDAVSRFWETYVPAGHS